MESSRRRAALDRLVAAVEGGAEKIDAGFPDQWPRIFSALLCARRYAKAFELAEAALRRTGAPKAPEAFLWPWSFKIHRGVAEKGFCREELVRIDGAAADGGFPHWFAYCRGVLLDYLGEKTEALDAFRGARKLPGALYGWMEQHSVRIHSDLEQFPQAVAVGQTILEHAPGHWWVRCRTAEAQLACGLIDQALAQFSRAEELSSVRAKPEVVTWHGEVLLWKGDYLRAIEKFDRAEILGGRTFLNGWRGAAYLKLGDLGRAFADLTAAVELDPKDREARVWRGEAHRLLGRPAQALRDSTHADAGWWGLFNSGLIRKSGGDEAGQADDVAAIPPHVTGFLCGILDLPAPRKMTAAQRERLLVEGLRLARGIRRSENYVVKHIWRHLLKERAPDAKI